MDSFEGKVAFVSGAASGIGLGMVKAFLAKGMQVMMADIEEETLKKCATALDSNAVSTIVCDVSARESVLEARRLHIITDPRFDRMVEKRFDRIASDFEWAANSETLRMTGSPGAIE